jgi:DnaK suppressor protein
MQKETLQRIKKRLEKERGILEKALESFAQKDKKLPEDWDTRFPAWNGEVGGAALEQEADEVEEYATLLPIEHALENRLKDINLALKKLKKGQYGICEKCQKPISIKRLKIVPEARLCQRCLKEIK